MKDQGRKDFQATQDWKDQHANPIWTSYTSSKYVFAQRTRKDPSCEADEWPPAYFLKSTDKQFQLVRYIPGSENGGAANSLWTSFCPKNDGGAGNGQVDRNGKIDEKLVSLDKQNTKTELKSQGGTTTTITSFYAKYTWAVFEIDFDPHWANKPEDKNKWLLEDNPCWPKGIVPEDPGYAVLTDDSFYSTLMPKTDLRKAYSAAPAADRKKSADQWLAQQPPPTPDDSSDDSSSGKPAAKKPKTGPPSPKRDLEIIDNGFAIRDANSSRRLTSEEIRRDVQFIDCEESTCSRERMALGSEGGAHVIVRKERRKSTLSPSVNPDTFTTVVSKPATTLEVKVDRRKAVSPELPKTTVSAS